MWEVEPWKAENDRSPVESYVESLDQVQKVRLIKALVNLQHLLNDRGLQWLIQTQDIKKVHGANPYGLHEFRHFPHRIFCVFRGSICWLLHAFTKKRQSTPLKEIKTAERRAKTLPPIK
jgi:phage-related protein